MLMRKMPISILPINCGQTLIMVGMLWYYPRRVLCYNLGSTYCVTCSTMGVKQDFIFLGEVVGGLLERFKGLKVSRRVKVGLSMVGELPVMPRVGRVACEQVDIVYVTLERFQGTCINRSRGRDSAACSSGEGGGDKRDR